MKTFTFGYIKERLKLKKVFYKYTMPCQNCKKKCGVPIDCNYCTGKYCSGCIQLEKHKCDGYDVKKKTYLNNLEKQLDFKPECKYAFLR
tara:strand:+ start:164 stop:430 length:267 start_codon:yes stop_codon:yes gene_type:complete